MSQKPKHHQDPNYAAFAERYRTDIVAFAEEVLGLEVSPNMVEILRACAKPGARVAITSPPDSKDHPGVSPLVPLGLWRLFFGGIAPAAPSATMVGCPTSKLSNGNDYRWYAVRAVERVQWLAPYLRVTGERIYLDSCRSWEGSHIVFLSVLPYAPENIAGFWCENGGAWLMEDAHKIAHQSFRVAAAPFSATNGGMAISCRGERPAASDGLGFTWEEFVLDGAPTPQSEPQSR